MIIRTFITVVFIVIPLTVHSQVKYAIEWEYTGQSFENFVLEAESRLPVKFFYNPEWIKNLTLGSYGDKLILNEILDSLFREKSIYHYTSLTGNIILTKSLAIKSIKEKPVENMSYIPGMDYSEDRGIRITGENLVADIGNPDDRYKPGNVTLSGYTLNQDTKEPVAGVTVYVPKLSAGAISNAYGFYKISLPRGTYSVRFTFIGMKEKAIDLNLFNTGELNVEMKSVLVALKEAVITAEKDIKLQRAEVGHRAGAGARHRARRPRPG
jgi:hypothetical protein